MDVNVIQTLLLMYVWYYWNLINIIATRTAPGACSQNRTTSIIIHLHPVGVVHGTGLVIDLCVSLYLLFTDGDSEKYLFDMCFKMILRKKQMKNI